MPKSQDRELKRMSRAELVEVIYELQRQLEQLEKENDRLEEELQDRRVRLENAGSIAQAAVEVSHLLEAAQTAADLYVDSVKALASGGAALSRDGTEQLMLDLDGVGDAGEDEGPRAGEDHES